MSRTELKQKKKDRKRETNKQKRWVSLLVNTHWMVSLFFRIVTMWTHSAVCFDIQIISPFFTLKVFMKGKKLFGNKATQLCTFFSPLFLTTTLEACNWEKSHNTEICKYCFPCPPPHYAVPTSVIPAGQQFFFQLCQHIGPETHWKVGYCCLLCNCLLARKEEGLCIVAGKAPMENCKW